MSLLWTSFRYRKLYFLEASAIRNLNLFPCRAVRSAGCPVTLGTRFRTKQWPHPQTSKCPILAVHFHSSKWYRSFILKCRETIILSRFVVSQKNAVRSCHKPKLTFHAICQFGSPFIPANISIKHCESWQQLVVWYNVTCHLNPILPKLTSVKLLASCPVSYILHEFSG